MAVRETLKQLGKTGIDDLRSYTPDLMAPNYARAMVIGEIALDP